MRIIRWLDDYLEYVLSVLFYLYLTLIIFIEVVRRYVFDAATTWGEETAVYAFVWMTYIAAAKVAKERSHLSVDILVGRMGRHGKFVSAMISDVCFFILAAVVFYYSLVTIPSSIQYGQTMLGVDLPIALATASVPVGWLLVIVRVVQRSVKTIREYTSGQDIQAVGENVGE
ncbi:MAG: TRAP transporter small permease [Rubrobacteraceae bacterium]